MLFVSGAHMRHESLRVVSAQVDSHVDLLLEIVVILSRPRLGELGSAVLLKECALVFWL